MPVRLTIRIPEGTRLQPLAYPREKDGRNAVAEKKYPAGRFIKAA
jgi:hypothetical protein